ncbi:MAG TPA: diaminopimelate epimerase [Burkholderiales bacterium]|jgi:diaminopimelate epimerase
MNLKFTKMQGLGNDFVVLDAIADAIELSADQLRFVADRHFGVGCDQILQVERPRTPDTDFYYRIFNADGGEVEHCGNGARCLVRYVHDRGLTQKNEIRVGTQSGVIVPRLEADGQVSVDMGVPSLDPRDVPFVAPAQALTYQLDLGNRIVEISALSLGNPHAVQIVPDVDAAPVALEGPRIEAHPRFPRRVNAGFAQVLDRRRLRLRVYERGAGETLACGTGACAAVVAGIMRDVLDRDRVTVETRGGSLLVSWPGEGRSVLMTGPAVTVFHGAIAI